MEESVRSNLEVSMSQQSIGRSDDERKGKGDAKSKIRRKQQLLLASSSEDPEQLMDTPLLQIFFAGKSAMTIHRWRNHSDPERRFPPPDMHIGAIPYWFRRTIIAYRDRIAKLPRPGSVQNLPNHSTTASRAETAPPQLKSSTGPNAGGVR
jgi:hypothetical protein